MCVGRRKAGESRLDNFKMMFGDDRAWCTLYDSIHS